MKFYIIYNLDFSWSLFCSSDIKSYHCDSEFFYEEIDYEEFIHNLDFLRNA